VKLADPRQLTFDEVARSRRSDPETSKSAAAQAHGVVAEHELLILRAMRDGGERDWTPHEIADCCDLNSVQVTRRLSALWVAGLIIEVKVGEIVVTRRTPSGRRARCWRLP